MIGFEARLADGLKNRWAGRQAIVVRARSEDSADAQMWLYEQAGNGWCPVAGPWPAALGRNGVSKLSEGDCKSPSGVFLLGTAFGHVAKPGGVSYPYRMLDVSDRWVDDPGSPFYNRWVRGHDSACGGGEDLSKIGQYKYAAVIHYNDESARGRGSAIFLHVWQGPDKPTSGCTAVSEENMLNLLEWLDYSKRPVLIQGTCGQIEKLMTEEWSMLCLPQGWGFVDDLIPDAQLDIRYFTDSNFTGRKLPGYLAPLAPMRLEAIHALSNAAEKLRRKNLGIRVFDAYRPQQATDAMIAWAEDTTDIATKEAYYPGIDKRDIPGQFVARRSAHRLGGTVDLTLLDWGNGIDLDMGGPFDFFGELSAFNDKGIAQMQSRNRTLLRDVMTEDGFNPYDREWWHFSFPLDGEGGLMPIIPREYRAI